jgi:hypothetical protein
MFFFFGIGIRALNQMRISDYGLRNIEASEKPPKAGQPSMAAGGRQPVASA